MRLLVTGGTGFIGSNAIPRLLDAGHVITAVVRDAARAPARCTSVVANLDDRERMRTVAGDIQGCEALIHLAAVIPGRFPDEAGEGTIQNLLNVLPETLLHIVYASTLDVYGAPQFLPITEEHPLEPITRYGQAKRAIEEQVSAFATARNITYTILRFSQVYGPGEPCIKAIPHFIGDIIAGRAPVVFGDGAELRDYIYVDDAVTAIQRALASRAEGSFTIATGESIELRHVLDLIIEISGTNLQPEHRQRQKPRIDFAFDVSRARDELGFSAQTHLREGLRNQYRAAVETA